MTPQHLLFVCLGNICRSPVAEAMMRKLIEDHGADVMISVDSAGTSAYNTGRGPDARMVEAAARRGLRMNHIARQVRPSDFDSASLIIAMDDSNYDNLRAIAPTVEAANKVKRIADFFNPDTRRKHDSVPDPYYGGEEGFQLSLDLIKEACENILNTLR